MRERRYSVDRAQAPQGDGNPDDSFYCQIDSDFLEYRHRCLRLVMLARKPGPKPKKHWS